MNNETQNGGLKTALSNVGLEELHSAERILAANNSATSDIGPFAIVPDWLLRSRVSDRALRLFALLARHADRGQQAFPARSLLAAALRTSIDSVDRACKELVTACAVRVQRRFDASGDQTSNLYFLTFVAPSSRQGVAAPLRSPSRTDAATGSRTPAATGAAPVRRRTITTVTKERSSEEDLCAEPKDGSTPPLLVFQTTGAGPSTWELSADQLAAWQQVYPALDVLGECRRAHAWLDAQQTRRKTARGMPRFLVSWLNRTVDRASSRAVGGRIADADGLSRVTESALRAVREAQS